MNRDGRRPALTPAERQRARRRRLQELENREELEEYRLRDRERETPPLSHYEVAIIGGGVSGLYAALKLVLDSRTLAESGVKNVLVMEKTDYWGGRLDTDLINLREDGESLGRIKEEEGGMRFTYHEHNSNMPCLAELIQELGLEDEVEPFYMEPQAYPPTAARQSVPNCNVLYVNGHYFTEWFVDQNPHVWTTMFNLQGAQETLKSADDIFLDVYMKVLTVKQNEDRIRKQFPKEADVILENKDMDLLQKYAGPKYWSFFRNCLSWKVGKEEIPLNAFSMEALLTVMGYSHGVITMMKRTQGFLQDVQSGGNAGSILQDVMTFNIIGDRLFQFRKGWGQLIQAMVDTIQSMSGTNGVHVTMLKNCQVDKIADTGCGGFKLSFGSRDVAADRVIMTLPPQALQKIVDMEDRAENKTLQRLSKSVIGFEMSKINLYFEYDWWNKVEGVKMYGPNITSLPCAFIYPFYAECKRKGCVTGCAKCDDDKCAAALTIYSDINNTQFWNGLQTIGPLFTSPLQNRQKDLLPASKAVVAEALKELKQVFNMADDVPAPILTSFRFWGGEGIATADPEQGADFGYGVHMWRIGVDDNEIRREVCKPFSGKRLYMCNEAWSEYQSWVEGSLLSTNAALDKFYEDLS